MAALHEALKSLGPTDYSEVPVSYPDELNTYLADAFSNGQIIVDSVPIPAPSGESTTLEGRERASSTASNASEISVSSARSSPPPPDVEVLQKEWKPVKLNPRDNPLGMNVYKLGAKDGRGSWFARRSVHEGLGFTKWKMGLEKEFPETMKVRGGPGEGNIRGIGGEKRVGYKDVEGVGKVEVYHLSAQFPGPTTPRDFVTLLITSDQALKPRSDNEEDLPRHYMVISKPCIHPDAPPRDGFIRGQYESVEFIREIPLKKAPKKSASATNLRNGSRTTLGKEAAVRNAIQSHPPIVEEDVPKRASRSATDLSRSDSSRSRGKTISFAESRGHGAKGENMDNPIEEDECEQNPIEWIMITRSDPGGSVPRFMIERGTPGGIVADASKFLDWACAVDIEALENTEVEVFKGDEKDLHDYQTNGHLAGLDGTSEPAAPALPPRPTESAPTNGSGIYNMVAGAAEAAGQIIASHAPEMVTSQLPGQFPESTTNLEDGTSTPRRESVSSTESDSSIGTFTSALTHGPSHDTGSILTQTDSPSRSRASSQQEKELQKLEDKKRKLEEKLSKARSKEQSKKSDDTTKEEEAMKKAEERHKNEIAKLEAKAEKEMAKLEAKKQKEEKKAEERKRKLAEKDEKVRMTRELEEARAELSVLRKEKDILRAQVGELQAENTAMAVKLGKLGSQGDQVLKEVRQEVGKAGRLRASSLKSTGRTNSFKSLNTLSATSSQEQDPDHLHVPVG